MFQMIPIFLLYNISKYPFYSISSYITSLSSYSQFPIIYKTIFPYFQIFPSINPFLYSISIICNILLSYNIFPHITNLPLIYKTINYIPLILYFPIAYFQMIPIFPLPISFIYKIILYSLLIYDIFQLYSLYTIFPLYDIFFYFIYLI